MSKINEDRIRDRLKALSQTGPAQEATDRAMQKVRDTLMTDEGHRVGPALSEAEWVAPPSLFGGLKPTLRIMKLAAAAVLMIGLGYLGGRLSAPLDAEQLRADIESSLRATLEPAIRQDVLKEVDDRWQSAFAAKGAELKDELQHQVRRDLMEFASQTLAASGARTEQRLAELVQVIEAARIQDRRRVAEAFGYMGSRFGNDLVTMAAHTNELLSPE
ncbi:MAG: hypothetical protein ACYSWW_13120 [Planctomycetota bacterium]|jgi:hypothetical protein